MTASTHDVLSSLTTTGELYEPLPDNALRCFACAHECKIASGKPGVCRVRFNESGVLRVPFGYVGALQCDPVEKKPFFHVLPGTLAFSFGMLGCDFHCPFCQNWQTSQTLRDDRAGSDPMIISPKKIVSLAAEHKASMIVSTYNEPLITSEWAVAVFREAQAQGFKTGYVSNGHATEKVLNYLVPWINFYKVDLKSFNEKHYREMGGHLDAVLKSIRMIYERKIWLEIVTLCIPGLNDSEDELGQIAAFIAAVSAEIPWHVTAFHRDYKMLDKDNTSAEILLKAAQIGQAAGLRYVYAGNLPGLVGNLENTFCPQCKRAVIERHGFKVTKNRLQDGKCPDCNTWIPGVWE